MAASMIAVTSCTDTTFGWEVCLTQSYMPRSQLNLTASQGSGCLWSGDGCGLQISRRRHDVKPVLPGLCFLTAPKAKRGAMGWRAFPVSFRLTAAAYPLAPACVFAVSRLDSRAWSAPGDVSVCLCGNGTTDT